MDLIDLLRGALDRRIGCTEFMRVDYVPRCPWDTADSAMLEYRAQLAGGRVVLLSLCEVPAQRVITAQLWSPNDVTGASPCSTVESVAIRHREWLYDETSDPGDLAQAILQEAVSWLDLVGPMRDSDPPAPAL